MVLDSSRSDQLRGHQQARQLPIPDSEERISTASDVEPGSINHLTALGEKPGLAAEGKTQSRILRPASSGSDCATGWSFAPRPPFPKPRQIGRCTFIAGLQAKQPESHPHQDPVYSLGASHAQNDSNITSAMHAPEPISPVRGECEHQREAHEERSKYHTWPKNNEEAVRMDAARSVPLLAQAPEHDKEHTGTNITSIIEPGMLEPTELPESYIEQTGQHTLSGARDDSVVPIGSECSLDVPPQSPSALPVPVDDEMVNDASPETGKVHMADPREARKQTPGYEVSTSSPGEQSAPSTSHGRVRVTKSHHPRQRSRIAGPGAPLAATTSAAAEPTAEELLFLVMRRTRLQRQAEKRLITDHQELQLRNDRLQAEALERDDQLEAALAREQQQNLLAQGRQRTIDGFESRFQKLKAWAKRTSNDMASLREKGDSYKRDVASFRVEQNNANEQNKEMRKSLQQGLENLAHVKAELPVLADEAKTLKEKGAQLWERLARKAKEITQLKRTNLTLQDHIKGLKEAQEQLHCGIQQGQRSAGERIAQLETLVRGIEQAIETLPSRPTWVDQLLTDLTKIAGKHRVGPDDLAGLDKQLQAVSDNLNALSSSTVSSFESTAKFVERLNAESASQVSARLESLRTDLVELHEQSSRSQEYKTIERTLGTISEESRSISQMFKANGENDSKLQSLIAELRQSVGEESRRGFVADNFHQSTLLDLETRLSERLAAANNELAKAKEEAQTHLAQLRSKDNTVEQLNKDVSAANSSFEQRTREMQNQLDKRDELLKECANELTQKSSSVYALEHKLNDAKDDHNKVDARMQSLQQETIRLENVLKKSREEIARLTGALAAAIGERDSNCKQVAAWKANAETLAKEIETYKSTIQSKTEALKALQGEKEKLLGDNRELSVNLDKLRTDLVTKNNDCAKLKTANHLLSEEGNRLKNSLAEAAEIAQTVPGLQTRIDEMSHGVVDLQTKITKLADLPEKLSQANARTSELETSLNKAQQELDTTRKEASRCSGLEEILRTKNDRLATLEQQVRKSDAAHQNNEQLKKQCSENDDQVESLCQTITELEQASPVVPETYETTKEYPPGSNLSQEAFLPPQPMNLSGAHGGFVPIPNTVPVSPKPVRRRADRSVGQTHRVGNEGKLDTAGNKVEVPNSSNIAREQQPPDSSYVPETQYRLPFGTRVAIIGATQDADGQSGLSSPLSNLQHIDVVSVAEGAALPVTMPGSTTTRDSLKMQRHKGSEMSSSSQMDQMLLDTIETEPSTQISTSPQHKHSAYVAVATQKGGNSVSSRTRAAINTVVTQRLDGDEDEDRVHGQVRDHATPLKPRSSNIQASPASNSKEKHLPNSAAKRSTEADPRDGNGRSAKRLKRTPANTDVPSTPKGSPRSFGQAESSEETLARNQTRLPIGSLKGSVVGTRAPVPVKSRKTTAPRKGSKAGRYESRFSQE